MGRRVAVLHGADLHLGLRRYGRASRSGSSRIDDFAATLQRFADAAAEHAQLAVLAGDTFDSRVPSVPELTALSRAVSRLRAAGVPLVVVPGNHDGPETIAAPDTHTLGWIHALQLAEVWVPLTPERRRIETPAGPIDVTAVPYPHKNAFGAELAGTDPDLRTMEIARRVDRLIGTLQPAVDEDVPQLFVGHLTVTGSRLGSERLMRTGWDVAVAAEQLEPWDYAALGHIHYQQQVTPKAWYAGSMEYIDFGESGTPKGWLLATVAAHELPVVQPIRSGARPLGVFEIEQAPDGSLTDTSEASWYAGGPIIRVRVVCRYQRPASGDLARIRDGILAKGASYVETEQVLEGAAAESRATRPEVAAAVAAVLTEHADAGDGDGPPPATVADLSMADALKVWLTANGKPLEPTLTVGTRMIAAQAAEEGRTA